MNIVYGVISVGAGMMGMMGAQLFSWGHTVPGVVTCVIAGGIAMHIGLRVPV